MILNLNDAEAELVKKSVRILEKLSGSQAAKASRELRGPFYGRVYGLTVNDAPALNALLAKVKAVEIPKAKRAAALK